MNSTPIHISDLPAIGTALQGGFYGGIIQATGGLLRAVAWAPRAEGETSAILLPKGNAPLVALSCHDSLTNTRALAELGSAAAQWALGLRIAGYADWTVPARDVLELGYRHFKPTAEPNDESFRDGDNPSSVPPGYPYTDVLPLQTTVEAFREGGPEAFSKRWYHTSTQYSASNAWAQNFNHGGQHCDNVSAEGGVRAVRLIPLIS